MQIGFGIFPGKSSLRGKIEGEEEARDDEDDAIFHKTFH
jgi:hypothetical protein